MFTGIIHHTGQFKGYSLGKQTISIQAPSLASRLEPGDSLAINGVCLSLIKKEKDTLLFNLSEETLQKSTLGSMRFNESLNLELPLTLSSPLGGHLVTGHVDSTGKILNIKPTRNGKRFTISFPVDLKPFFIAKGSVALDGVSLTVAQLHLDSLEVEVIPITLEKSSIGNWKKGQRVNIECDIIGKYVYNWTVRKQQSRN
jgi:riboflavin synthase